MKKKLVLIWLLCVASAWCALAAPPPYQNLPGWRKKDQCAPFAEAFEAKCNASGVPAVRLTYDWSAPSGAEGRHVVVLFKDGGELWLMDNEHLKPWRVAPGYKTDLEVMRHNAPYVVSMVNNISLATAQPRTLEELFPDLTKWQNNKNQ